MVDEPGELGEGVIGERLRSGRVAADVKGELGRPSLLKASEERPSCELDVLGVVVKDSGGDLKLPVP